jgi:hypothetical protein
MQASSKAVVMAKVSKDKHVRLIPLAVFSRAEQCAPYGRAVRDAIKAGDEMALTGLILDSGVPASDFIGADVKLSVAVLRYCPTTATVEDDPFADEASPAS